MLEKVPLTRDKDRVNADENVVSGGGGLGSAQAVVRRRRPRVMGLTRSAGRLLPLVDQEHEICRKTKEKRQKQLRLPPGGGAVWICGPAENWEHF